MEQRVGAYGEAAQGSVVGLIGSEGHLEVAVVNGSAAKKLRVGVGAPVEVRVDADDVAGPVVRAEVDRPYPPG